MTQHRDLDLLREILERIRVAEPRPDAVDLEFPDREEREVSYHVKLLHQAAFIEPKDVSMMGNPMRWRVQKLTFASHESLCATEDPYVWDAVKRKVREMGGAVPVEVLKARAIAYVRDNLGLS